jgi:hypothetical protein
MADEIELGDDPDDEVITSSSITAQEGAQLGDRLPKRQWTLALSLLAVVAVIDFTLLTAVVLDQLTANDAVALSAVFQGPLLALLGAAVAFYYPRD